MRLRRSNDAVLMGRLAYRLGSLVAGSLSHPLRRLRGMEHTCDYCGDEVVLGPAVCTTRDGIQIRGDCERCGHLVTIMLAEHVPALPLAS